jgi:ribonuclease HI
MRVLLQVDGTPGNGRGQAGLGAVIRDERGAVLCWRGDHAVARSNNEAEYLALILGLRLVAEQYPGAAVRCLTDSRLVVDQMEHRAASRVPRLVELYAQAEALRAQIGVIEFVHVPREVNRLADALAWEALAGTTQLMRRAGGASRQVVAPPPESRPPERQPLRKGR